MKRSVLMVVLSLAGAGAIGSAQGVLSYSLVKEIPIGGAGGGDYLSIDPAAHRLYVSHSTRVIVIDTLQNTVVGEIKDTQGVHGFAIAADLGRGFSTNGRENTVSIVDLKTLRTLQKVPTGTTPDAVLYDPSVHEVYSMNGQGLSATVIDGRAGTVIATIPLGGKPESAAVDVKTHRVFINIEDKNTIAVVDTSTHTVVAQWPIAPGAEATGMAFDPQTRRLFVGCRNKMMLMIDSTNGKVLGSVPTGEGVDATWFDPSTRLVFSSAREGTVTIARAEPAGLTTVEAVKTFPGARTMALDTTTHRIYLSTATYLPVPPGAAAVNGQAPRATPVPESFRVLVFAPREK
ncbi:MAG: YncE family protein [Vicinamibacterales bacterium]